MYTFSPPEKERLPLFLLWGTGGQVKHGEKRRRYFVSFDNEFMELLDFPRNSTVFANF